MSLFKGPFQIKVNNEDLPDVEDFWYNTENKTLTINLLVTQFDLMNHILADKKWASLVTIMSGVNIKTLQADRMWFTIEKTNCKITHKDGFCVVAQLTMKIISVKFDKVDKALLV